MMVASLSMYSAHVAAAVRHVFVELATHFPPSAGGR